MLRTAEAMVTEIVIMLQTGQLKNCDFIHDEGRSFLFCKVPRPALGHIQPPVLLVSGPLSQLIKWPCCEADPFLPPAWSYTSTPFLCVPSWHDN